MNEYGAAVRLQTGDCFAKDKPIPGGYTCKLPGQYAVSDYEDGEAELITCFRHLKFAVDYFMKVMA